MTKDRPSEPKILAAINTADVRFREVSYPADYRMSTHRNSCSHLFLCLSGAVEHRAGRFGQHMVESELGYVPVDAPHSDQFWGEVRTFDILLGAKHMGTFPELDAGRSFFRQDRPATLAISAYQEFKHPDNLTPIMLEALTLELLVSIHRWDDGRLERAMPRWLARVREILHEDLPESPSLEQLGHRVGVHPAHLTRAFREWYRCSIGEYVRRLRVDRARQLLERTDRPIAEIALTVGFGDQSHLTRTFRKYTGTTPLAYRQANSVRSAESRNRFIQTRHWS